MLLPGSQEDNRRLISSAEQTVKDVRGFCQRNPQVCEDVRVTMTTLLTRFKSGAELAQTWLTRQNEDAGSVGDRGTTTHRSARGDALPQPVAKWQDSLNTSDKQITWRGPTGF